MTPRHVRALRGTAAAWVATVVAATAHTLAGGGRPLPALVAAVGILASPFAVGLIGRRLSAWRVGATVLASQALFHVAFAVTGRRGRCGAARAPCDAPRRPALSAVVAPRRRRCSPRTCSPRSRTVVALHGGERMLRALGRGIRSMFTRAPRLRARVAPTPRLVCRRRALSARAPRILLSRRLPARTARLRLSGASSAAPVAGRARCARRVHSRTRTRRDAPVGRPRRPLRRKTKAHTMTTHSAPVPHAAASRSAPPPVSPSALGAPLAASAHVHVNPGTASAGGTETLTFSFSHGCDGSPTTALAIDIPDGRRQRDAGRPGRLDHHARTRRRRRARRASSTPPTPPSRTASRRPSRWMCSSPRTQPAPRSPSR